jgi:hypothetical protein
VAYFEKALISILYLRGLPGTSTGTSGQVAHKRRCNLHFEANHPPQAIYSTAIHLAARQQSVCTCQVVFLLFIPMSLKR